MLRSAMVSSYLCAVLCVLPSDWAQADVRPTESLLPNSTRACIQISDVDEVLKKFDATQFGRLINAPEMQPFVEDLRRQLESKLSDAGWKVGLEWDDVKDIYGGEVCLAAIQPGNKSDQHALVLIVDITDHRDQADKLLKKVDKNQQEEGNNKKLQRVKGTQVVLTTFERPKSEGDESSRPLVYFIHDDWLVVADHVAAAVEVYTHMGGDRDDGLDSLPAYRESTVSVVASGVGPADIRWFAEPFGIVDWLRSAAGSVKRRGTDWREILSNQGFQAIQGIGGQVTLATDEEEVVHTTMIYAPPVQGEGDAPTNEKYTLAARMLQFPQSDDLLSQPWIPRDLAIYWTFNWKLQDAMKFVSTLVDEVLDYEGAFVDMKDSLRDDPNGPQIDVDNEFIPYLGERVSMMSDYVIPITIHSERLLFAIETNNPKSMESTVRKAMRADPNASEMKVEEHAVWSIIEESQVKEERPAVDGLPFGFDDEIEFEDEDDFEPLFPNKYVTVAHGHLIMSTSLEQLTSVLKPIPTPDRLGASADYQLVGSVLSRLGAGSDSARYFSRTDEEIRPSYELIRRGKMPESETIFGRLLNVLLAPEDEDELREQQIDGSKLPDFQVVRCYLGPAGIFIQTEQNGWMVKGVLLSKDEVRGSERVAKETNRAGN